MHHCCWWLLLIGFPANFTRDFNETFAIGTKLEPGGLIARWRVPPHNEIQGWGWGGHVSSICVQVWILKKWSCKLFRVCLYLGAEAAVKFQLSLKTRLKTHILHLSEVSLLESKMFLSLYSFANSTFKKGLFKPCLWCKLTMPKIELLQS